MPGPDDLTRGDARPDAVIEGATEPLASLAARRATRTALDGSGAYVRDAEGMWFDARTGDPIAGATDLTLGQLFDPAIEARDGGTVRVVPRSWASRHPDHPLAWIYEYADLGGREAVAVPTDVWDERSGAAVAMAAPELHPQHLLGIDGVALCLGVSEATVRSYLARDQMPPPITRLGGSPVWPRPLIERWMATRRRRGPPRSPDAADTASS